jgi:hypothetical protein
LYVHGERTKNTRELEDKVERNEEGAITSKRQRDNINIRQLSCKWEALCFFKKSKGIEGKGYTLTMKCDIYSGYELVDDLFLFSAYLKQSEEFFKAFRQAKKY